MKIDELAEEILKRHWPKYDEDKITRFANDLRRLGLEEADCEGLFDTYLKTWTRSRQPRPAEIMAYKPAKPRDPETKTHLPDGEQWAWDQCLRGSGKQAVDMGVGYSAYLFFKDNPGKVLPSGFVDEMLDAKERTRKRLKNWKGTGEVAKALNDARAAMEERHRWFAEEITRRMEVPF